MRKKLIKIGSSNHSDRANSTSVSSSNSTASMNTATQVLEPYFCSQMCHHQNITFLCHSTNTLFSLLFHNSVVADWKVEAKVCRWQFQQDNNNINRGWFSSLHQVFTHLYIIWVNQCNAKFIGWCSSLWPTAHSLYKQTTSFFLWNIWCFGQFWWKDYISELCILELMISNSLTAFGLARYLCADISTFFSCTFFFFLSSSFFLLCAYLRSS